VRLHTYALARALAPRQLSTCDLLSHRLGGQLGAAGVVHFGIPSAVPLK
jgi:hypothetical protein